MVNRQQQLHDALDLAITYLQDLMGSDADDSPTVQHLIQILNDEAPVEDEQ